MNSVAHIINPFDAPVDSDLYAAQPITFKSIIAAKQQAQKLIKIELFTTQYEEDRIEAPIEFTRTRPLERSVLDFHTFDKKIKLPLISDILERVFESSEAQYLIYTNVDIGLFPNFYVRVNEIINQGHDAFIINRRRILDKQYTVDDLDEIFREKGKKHPGFDCFIFNRRIFKELKLNGICIGVPYFEISFSQNLFSLSEKFILIDNEKLTFHIGMEIFKKRAPKEYVVYHKKQFWQLIKTLNVNLDKFPYHHLFWPFRIIKWGLHPCIPIKLVIREHVKKATRFLKI